MSRLSNQLERMFRALNQDFFNGELNTPIITIIPTQRAYAHYVPADIWECKGGRKREINISAAYLNRPLEYICASLLHEAVHMHSDTILGVQDTSRNGTYHNVRFKENAEAHGLICTKTAYGWSDTSSILSDRLLDWVLLHDEFREVELCRSVPGMVSVGVGARSADGNTAPARTTKGNSRRYVCPGCGMIVRATREVNIICGDCRLNMWQR